MTLMECLRQIKDPRMPRGIRHSSEEILLLVLLALVSGRQTLSSIASYSEDQWDELKEEFGFHYKSSPDRTTISRLLEKLSLKEFQEKILNWIEEIGSKTEVVSVDGKTVKQSFVKDEQGLSRHLQILSVFAHNYHLVLEQYKMTGQKEFEPIVLREHLKELIERFPLIKLFVMDALYANRPMLKAIEEVDRYFLVGLKENQSILYDKADEYFKRIVKTRKALAHSYDKKKGHH
ncbi:MAG: ISAs1 family transposase [Bacteroidota bacterium]|nr:ISAs1 family transposase [Bacteroidota bacterium]